jgi:hypothetical protein
MQKSSEEAASLAQELEAAQASQQALQEKYDSLEASEVCSCVLIPDTLRGMLVEQFLVTPNSDMCCLRLAA